MGVCLYLALGLLAGPLAGRLRRARAPPSSALVVGGMAVFALFCQLTGAVDFRKLCAAPEAS